MCFMSPAAARLRPETVPLLFILAALALPAQTPPQDEPPTFRSTAALVSVDVLVTLNGSPVTGLNAGDFIVREEGVPKPIESFAHTAAPLQVLLLLDVSGSMGKMLRQAAETGRQALAQLAPQDEVAVIFFARRARLHQELTPEKQLAARALREAAVESSLGAGTSLNDALLEAAAYLEKLPPFSGRRALIVLTDNGGVHYQLPDETVIRALSRVNAVVNAIVPENVRPPEPPRGADVNPDFTPANIFRISEALGGEVMRAKDAGRRLHELIERIRSRYNLTIRPSAAPPGAFRRLSVELARTSQEARRFQIRARNGYYIPEDEPR
jgi:VWFA-related protein